jgi:hypothetical protein
VRSVEDRPEAVPTLAEVLFRGLGGHAAGESQGTDDDLAGRRQVVGGVSRQHRQVDFEFGEVFLRRGNFRRKVLGTPGFVTEALRSPDAAAGSAGGRPPLLYRSYLG